MQINDNRFTASRTRASKSRQAFLSTLRAGHDEYVINEAAGSENDIRACVTKRKISGDTISENGRTARDVLPGLMKTCCKLGVSFWRYLGDRLRVPSAMSVPPLPDLVRQASATPA